MGIPVVVASNGYGTPVTVVTNGYGTPVEIAANGYGMPVVVVASGGMPVVGSFGPDVTVPLAVSFSPTDNATDVNVATLLIVEFDSIVTLGTGNVTLKRTSDNATIEAWDVVTEAGTGAGQVSVEGFTQLTMRLTTSISGGTGYYVIWDAGVVEDLAANPVAAQASTTLWSFTTEGAASVPASIAFDSVDTDGGGVDENESFTFALTAADAAGAERVVILAGLPSIHANNDFVSCTIDGQTGTRLGSVVLGAETGGVRAFVTAYRATGTANTSINVVATAGDGYGTFAGYCACYRLSGAGTVLATATSTSNDPTLSLNTVTGGAVVAALYCTEDVTTSTTWTGVTEDYENSAIYGNHVFSGGSANVVSGETPRAVSADVSAGMTETMAAIAISFNPA